jgi:DNA polymerase I-like protein with 3'-5' exonuclease and polymerase domains
MESLREKVPSFIEMEHQVAQILQTQEEYGWRFDETAAWELASALEEELRQISRILQQRHPYYPTSTFTPSRSNKTRGYVEGCPFTRITELNVTSRDHISWVLQKHYGWKPEKLTTTGKPVIDEVVLATLHIPIAAEFARALTIKKILGMISHGVNAWLKQCTTAKRIHHHCSTATNTFRCAQKKPNLGQVPSDSKYRELFIASPGYTLVGADLSGIELRVLAHYLSRYDNTYAETLLNDDIHQVNANKLGITRSQVKTVQYSFLYGASNLKIGKSFDPLLSDDKASKKGAEIKAAFIQAIPGLDKLLAACESAFKRGFIRSIDGRRVFLDSKHKTLNYLLQSTAAVIAKRWMIIAHENIKQLGIEAHQLAFVHDELQFETLPLNVHDLSASLVLAATQAGEFYNFRVRIDAEAKSGSAWSETH